MKFDSEIKSLGFCETVYDSTAEESVETEFNLPDYCPEIKRIVKCCLKTDITSVQKSDGRVNVQANACVRVIYIGDNDKTSAYEQVIPIQKTADSDKISSGCIIDVKANTDYVNCRATSPRRVEIKAMITFVYKATCKREETVLSSAVGSGIQSFNKEYVFTDLRALTQKAFNLTEVIELNSTKPVIGRIINSSAYVLINSKKIINNKMLLKGDCFIKIFYLSENECNVEFTEHSIPVSQIIEVDGITEDCDTTVDVGITACEASAKVDSSGETKLIDLNIRVSVKVFAFNNQNISLITDAYSTECDLKNNVKHLNVLSENCSFDNVFTNKIVLESIGVSVEKIIAVWCEDAKYGCALKNNSCAVNGNYQVNIIYRDSEKQTGIIQKPVDFEYIIDLKKPAESIVSYPSLQISACSCSMAGESKLELKTEMNISGKILSSEIVKYISEIELTEPKDETKENCALTIYFSDENEKVWDIAKKYKTTAEAIMQENELDSDLIESRRILLIPSV